MYWSVARHYSPRFSPWVPCKNLSTKIKAPACTSDEQNPRNRERQGAEQGLLVLLILIFPAHRIKSYSRKAFLSTINIKGEGYEETAYKSQIAR